MKQKFNAGADLDVVSGSELRQAMSGLQDWMVSVAKGLRPVDIEGSAVADGTGLIQVGGALTLSGGRLGPEAGFWWAVTRLAVRIDNVPAAFSLYLNHPGSNAVIRDVDATAGGYLPFGAHELLVGNSDTLYLRGSGSTPGTSRMTVTGQAIEIPQQLLWRWLS